ncbi:ankyrin repeat protein, partial [Mycena galericulata]
GTVLHLASEKRHIDVVQFLLDNGADVNAETALQMAARQGHDDIVQILPKNGANLGAASGENGENRRTAMQFASRS